LSADNEQFADGAHFCPLCSHREVNWIVKSIEILEFFRIAALTSALGFFEQT
jgi:hypothetical protein